MILDLKLVYQSLRANRPFSQH